MHPWEQAALLGFAGTPQLPRDSEKQEAKETEPEAHNIEIPDPRAAFAKALRVHLEDTKSYQRHAATDSNHARNIFDSIKKDKAVHTIAQISSETLIDLLLEHTWKPIYKKLARRNAQSKAGNKRGSKRQISIQPITVEKDIWVPITPVDGWQIADDGLKKVTVGRINIDYIKLELPSWEIDVHWVPHPAAPLEGREGHEGRREEKRSRSELPPKSRGTDDGASRSKE